MSEKLPYSIRAFLDSTPSRVAVFWWRSDKNGWSVGFGRLGLVWNRQQRYRELRIQWINFADQIWRGWDKTIWFQKIGAWVNT